MSFISLHWTVTWPSPVTRPFFNRELDRPLIFHDLLSDWLPRRIGIIHNLR